MGWFIEVLRTILCCADECDYEKENENPERNPLLESLSRPTYGISSSHACSDPLFQHDPTIRYSNDDYTNFIKSRLTRKISDARSFQPWGRSQDLRCSTPAASRYPCSQSCSSPKLSQSSLDKLLASSLRPSLSSAKATLSAQSSSLKTLSPVAVDNFTSTNEDKKEKHAWVPRNTSGGYMVPKDIENSIKNEIGPEVLEKPLSLSANKNYFEEENKAKYARLPEKTSSIFMIPKDIKNFIKNEIVPEVLRKPLSLSTYTDYFAVLLYAEDYYTEVINK